jgi:RNA-binding protein Musashi
MPTLNSYDDNDASKPAPPPQAAAPVVTDNQPVQSFANDQPAISHDHNIGGDEVMAQDQDDDDDDDDVDFNLGGGTNNNHNVSHTAMHEDAPTPPPFGTVHKASAKEDG